MINQKTQQIVSTQKQAVLSLNHRNEEIDRQVKQIQLRYASFAQGHSNKLNNSNINLKQLQNALAKYNDKLSLVQESITGLNEKIMLASKQLNTLAESSLHQKLRLRKQLQFGLSFIGYDHPSAYFSTKIQQSRAFITHLKDEQWHTFIKYTVIPNDEVSTYHIKQTKVTEKAILTGIATNAVFGLADAYKNAECLAFYSRQGFLFENGVSKEAGRVVSEGEVITMRVDPIQWQIIWTVGQQQLTANSIPQQMRNKALYVVVLMLHKNDVVELYCE